MPGICGRCEKNVYFAEEKQALGKSWHKLCFTCAACRKSLDSGRISDHGGDMFCNSCYRKNFGPKGYGFGVGAGSLSMDDGQGYQSGQDKVDHQAEAYVAPKKATTVLAENTELNNHQNNKIPSGSRRVVSSGVKPKWGGAEICPRCEKSVFIAELMRGAGKAWHKSCFTCNQCNKRLDSSMLCEREGEIYCKSCYGKNFGPKGFGYGISTGRMEVS